MTIKLLVKDGKLVVKDGALVYIDTENPNPCECCEPPACCPDAPMFVVLTFEDLDNALEGNHFYGTVDEVFNVGGGGNNWTGAASDGWACESNDMEFEVHCVDGVYTLALLQSEDVPWPGMSGPGGLVLTATSVTCDPLAIVFEFTSDVNPPTGEACTWTAKTDQHFRITITESP